MPDMSPENWAGMGRTTERDGPARDAADSRTAELERQFALRTLERDMARRALHQQLKANAAVTNAAVTDAERNALPARLHGIAREMQHLLEELEARNCALAAAHWRLEQRVAERTAAWEAALAAKRDSEARSRRVADGVPQLVWTSHPEGQWDFANRRWQAYTGQPPAEIHGLGGGAQESGEAACCLLGAGRDMSNAPSSLLPPDLDA